MASSRPVQLTRSRRCRSKSRPRLRNARDREIRSLAGKDIYGPIFHDEHAQVRFED
jgi:hypothetical protein